jgi:hypothetical protein
MILLSGRSYYRIKLKGGFYLVKPYAYEGAVKYYNESAKEEEALIMEEAEAVSTAEAVNMLEGDSNWAELEEVEVI